MKTLKMKVYKRKEGYKAIIVEEDIYEKSCVLDGVTITEIIQKMDNYLKEELNYKNEEDYLMSFKNDIKNLLSNKDYFEDEKNCHVELINIVYQDRYIIKKIEETQYVNCEVCDYEGKNHE